MSISHGLAPPKKSENTMTALAEYVLPKGRKMKQRLRAGLVLGLKYRSLYLLGKGSLKFFIK